MTQLYHPVTSNVPHERLRDEFTLVTCDDSPDSLWHFQVAVSKSATRQPVDQAAPKVDGMQLLARFTRQEPSYAIEITGQLAAHEIDAADFLDAWIETQAAVTPLTVVSRKNFVNAGGHTGDVLATGDLAGVEWAGRVICLKYGPRLLFLSFRTALENYNWLAEEFFVSLMTFHMLDESPGVLAERVRYISAPIPVPWKIAIPMSCETFPRGGNATFADFGGKIMAQTESGMKAMGTLAVTVLAVDRAQSEPQAFDKILEAVREAGVQMAPAEAVASPPAGPFGEIVSLVAPAQSAGREVEVRIGVMRHPKLWVLATLVGPTRSDNITVWMRNKRLLDVIAMTAEIA